MSNPTLLGAAAGVGSVNVGTVNIDDVIIVTNGAVYSAFASMVAPGKSGTATITGWTQIGVGTQQDNSEMRAWRARVTAPGTLVLSATYGTIHALRVGNCDAVTILDSGPVYAGFDQFAGATTSQSVGPLSVATPDALIVGSWVGVQFSGDLTYAAPAGMTVRASDTAESGTIWSRHMTATVLATATGNTTKVATTNRVCDFSWSGILFAIRGVQTPFILPAGIASDLAFGATRIVPGGVTITIGAGIPSDEAFGTLSIGPGQEFGPVGGIASAEAMGALTVVPGLHTITPSGIPSDLTFGATRIVPGTVTITIGAGIPSAETFGEPLVMFGIASSDLPRAYGRTSIPYPAIKYELVCVARIPQTQGPPLLIETDPIDWSGLSYVDELSRPSALNAGCQVSKLTEPVLQRLRDLDRLATELWLYREGKRIYSGPLLGWQVQGETVTLQSQGLLSYLKYWFVVADMVFAGIDQHLIVKALVDQWQALDYGNFGIGTSNITASGMTRDATYLKKELHNVLQRVTEMGARGSGFDIDVDPLTRDLKLWFPGQGVDRSTGPDAIIFDKRNVTSGNVVCSAAPGDIASEGFGVGTGDIGLFSTKSNLELRQSFGRTGVTSTYDGVSEQTTLDDHTQALIDARGNALLIPGPKVRTTTDADIPAYDVGDTVMYEVQSQLGVSGAFRIRKRTVTVSKTGREESAIEFV